MKILMVNKFLFLNGGSETYMLELGKELIRQGHQVQFFGMLHPDNIVGNEQNIYTENMDFHSASALEKIKLSLKTIYSKNAYNDIFVVLEKFAPDVVHLNNFNFQLTPSIILAVKDYEKKYSKKVKLIYTAHDYQLICPNHTMKNPITNETCEKCIGGKFISCAKNKCIHSSLLKSVIGAVEGYYWNFKKVYENIDTIICCSEFLKSRLDSNPILKKKTITMHNFINADMTPDNSKEAYALYFGRYSQEKGIETLIEACKELPDVKFVFAGNGPLENMLEGIPNIKNVGFQTGDALKKLISNARFSITPSVCYENCPFSVMESISLHTPVIGARIGGVPELIQDNQTGLLFESGNKSELKKKINMLWNDADLNNRLINECNNVKFDTVAQYSKKLLTLYN